MKVEAGRVASDSHWISSTGDLNNFLLRRAAEAFKSGCFYLSIELELEGSYPKGCIQCVHLSLYSDDFERRTDSTWTSRRCSIDPFHGSMLSNVYQAKTSGNTNKFWLFILLASISALEDQNCTFIDWLNHHTTSSWSLNFQQIILLKNKGNVLVVEWKLKIKSSGCMNLAN